MSELELVQDCCHAVPGLQPAKLTITSHAGGGDDDDDDDSDDDDDDDSDNDDDDDNEFNVFSPRF